VEAVTPVEDPAVRVRLKEILDTMLNDRGHAWNWSRRRMEGPQQSG